MQRSPFITAVILFLLFECVHMSSAWNQYGPPHVLFLLSLANNFVSTPLSERHLAAQRGLHPPPPGHASVLHPQGHVSGPELQPSQTSAEDYPSSENHPHTRYRRNKNRNPGFCEGWVLKIFCFLRATRARQEYKVRKAGDVD